MSRKWKIAIEIVVYCVIACALLGVWKYQLKGETQQRIWHHELAADADATLGVSEVPSDYMVDDTFTSHLPLVIIDTGGEEIINYKVYDPETDSRVYQEGVDPYFKMTISVIDNPDMVNTLGDTPTLTSDGKIKIRGNYSASPEFTKMQYLIKLQTPEGENNPLEVMGMEASETWVLNGTQRDESHLRNYIAMNTGGEIEPYTPDMRFCEMVFKQGDKYEYMGLYILYEKVEQGIGRVEIEEVSNPVSLSDTSYLILRDRASQHGYNISVYSTENQNAANWLTLCYPSEKKITDEYWEYIQEDIREIEAALYSDDYQEFIKYRALLDVDSFVDYFLINEFFSNYDAGWNSTYMYKKSDGTLAIGPYWDFDGAMDNYKEELLELEKTVMQLCPWLDRLITDEYFVEKLVERYYYLRQGILDKELIQTKLEEAAAFIEMPASRDASRWSAHYDVDLFIGKEEATQLDIDRNRDTWNEEVVRLMDVIHQHGDYLDTGIYDLYRFVESYNAELYNTLVGVLFITAFFVSIILVQRARKGA